MDDDDAASQQQSEYNFMDFNTQASEFEDEQGGGADHHAYGDDQMSQLDVQSQLDETQHTQGGLDDTQSQTLGGDTQYTQYGDGIDDSNQESGADKLEVAVLLCSETMPSRRSPTWPTRTSRPLDRA